MHWVSFDRTGHSFWALPEPIVLPDVNRFPAASVFHTVHKTCHSYRFLTFHANNFPLARFTSLFLDSLCFVFPLEGSFRALLRGGELFEKLLDAALQLAVMALEKVFR